MKFKVVISETARRQLENLEQQDEEIIKQHLQVLEEDPFKPRPLADIKKLKGCRNPDIYRLRVGDFRVAYVIEGNIVKIAKVFLRGKGYSWLD